MKRNLPAITKLASLALLLAPCAAANAATVIFASFSDTNANQWVYSGGSLTATNGTAGFTSFGGLNQILNYTGPVTYTVNAAASGVATLSGGFITQQIDGQITFKNGGTTVLDIIFQGALISGTPNSNSTGITADTQIGGNVISYSTDGIYQVAPFVGPFSFSIALTQTPGLGLNGSNLADFTATASGSFSTNTERGGSSPTPLPPAALGGFGLLAGLTGVRRLRRKSA